VTSDTIIRDVRQRAEDAAYTVVGIGVLGFQQAQVRRRAAQGRLTETAKTARDQATSVAGDARAAAESVRTEVKARVEPVVSQFGERVEPFVADVRSRVEPVLEQVGATVRRVVEEVTPRSRPSTTAGPKGTTTKADSATTPTD